MQINVITNKVLSMLPPKTFCSRFFPSLQVVMASMFSSFNNFQVIKSIVRPISILMVDYLRTLQLSTNKLLHKMSMLSKPLLINFDYFISLIKRTHSTSSSNWKVWVTMITSYFIMSFTQTKCFCWFIVDTIFNRAGLLVSKLAFIVARFTTVFLWLICGFKSFMAKLTFFFHSVLTTIIQGFNLPCQV